MNRAFNEVLINYGKICIDKLFIVSCTFADIRTSIHSTNVCYINNDYYIYTHHTYIIALAVCMLLVPSCLSKSLQLKSYN